MQWLHTFKRYRTPVLAVLATLMLVSSAVWSFDVPWRDILGYLLLCVLGVTVIAALAALLGANRPQRREDIEIQRDAQVPGLTIDDCVATTKPPHWR